MQHNCSTTNVIINPRLYSHFCIQAIKLLHVGTVWEDEGIEQWQKKLKRIYKLYGVAAPLELVIQQR